MPSKLLSIIKGTFKLLLLISVIILLSPVFAQEPGPSGATSQARGAGGFKGGEVLVKFREGAPKASIQSALSAQGMEVLGEIHGLSIVRLSVPVGRELEWAEGLERNPLVEYAEPNYIVRVPPSPNGLSCSDQRAIARTQALAACTSVIPNDPYFPSQWNLNQIQAPAAWCITTGGEDVVIAVIDSGADLDHPELEGKLWRNPGEAPDNGLDDNGNGYIDDVYGWDFVNWDNDPQDDFGHGTFVAGIAAAETDNGIGIAGVSWGAKVMPIKVVDAHGYAYYFKITSGIYYAADNGAKIISMSFDSSAYSRALQAAVTYAHSKGCLLVAAAGDTSDGTYRYPAALNHVMSVVATAPDDEYCILSTHNDRVDVAAPGVNIYSFWEGGYLWRTSSRMAAPHVSGLAALVWSVNPTLTPDEVEDIIESTAVDLGDPGRDDYFGHGRIDANAAVRATPHYLQVDPSNLCFLACGDNDPPLQMLANPGTSYSTWSAEETTPWLSITSPVGNTPSSIMVSVDVGELPDYGVYTASITATSEMTNCVNNPQIVTVTLSYPSQCKRYYLPLFSINYSLP